MHNTLLFELGTEELPARFIPGLIKQLEENSANLLTEYRIEYENIKVMATPRRLTLLVNGLADKQQSSTTMKRGPAKEIAFDENGEPTKAAIGFARGQNIDPKDLEIREDNGKEYVYAVAEIVGENCQDVLPKLLDELITKFNLPVKMFWNNKQDKFLRPVRWLVCLFNDQVLPLNFGTVEASNISRGHRFLSQGDVIINSAENYEEVMRDSWVMVDHNVREETIKAQIEELADQMNASPEMPHDLLEEVNFLVEWPTALLGNFAEEFLEIPKEALITSMQEHQKYFALVDKEDSSKLLPYFVAVRNGDDHGIDKVKAGNERVLRARLSDARFFFEEDTKTSLESKREQLKSIIYKEQLGSVDQKVTRMEELGKTLLDILELSEPVRSLTLRAIALSKADLPTNMVSEFPHLQGIMGEKYARIHGEDEKVCLGISEHYLPRHTGDKLPQTMVGTITSIVDKVDNIASSFAIGERPSGSQDPYALRRQALGIVHIILETELAFSLEQLFHRALSLIPESALVAPISNILDDILDFVKLRSRTIFNEQGLPIDIIDSTLEVDKANVYKAYLRAKVLKDYRDSQELEDVRTAYTRVKNLANKAKGEDVYTELLQDETEKMLYHKYLNTEDKLLSDLEQDEISSAISELAGFKDYIDQFFDEVMVMVDDKHLQNNRLNLIYHIKEMYRQLADFSIIQD
ncbi:glycine--tRNA ligase subunit beta [Natranaerobius thermophilus]|uniref:Glycine--tRNA ligase beta subunit n=1 Tax=Natranaerobius thermophilus (strain ATCC BAA-1301 / DSM 18059 / JW/NM-WN-LF) TaxID=457570 RepID=SYGB_NATTJ|nr:glycine--tRNA ligase subunit beta [Natranaerobius thermophilus]B2A1Y6.1 RecName: Full=Glycine--tRNA ligase beta subunit; AltName: Full=Glycyl-tRNA synthetase beta subunit; Short=GlyRS [Natranaerobius thermophilus JW/NM-WN-LF]ACB84791.1 glycyl-tRNA synthetase, beta subunit [Natranaerobius thermophilus JW/NM-WN-LF]